MKPEEAIRIIDAEIICLELDIDNEGVSDLKEDELEAFKKAISALEKQVAKKVRKWKNGTNHCPNEDC